MDYTSTIETKKSFRIVFLGDSITSAEWVHPNWREIVEYVLKEELSEKTSDWKIPSWGIRCINSGFDGSTTSDWLDRLQSDVLDYKPDLVIVMGTSNDMFFDIDPTTHKNNLITIFDKSDSENIRAVYCTDICSNNSEYDKKYLPYVKEVLRLFPYKNVLSINMFEEFKKQELNRFFTFVSTGNDKAQIKPGDIDFIHPNQLGNAYIAKVILEKVFDITFDPERYITENNSGKMFPNY